MYIRSDLQQWLPLKHIFLQKINPLLQFTDKLINLVADIRFPRHLPAPKGLHYLDHLDDKVQDFILPFQDDQYFKRGITELNWIIQNPWIISGEETDISRRYYFSSIAKEFMFRATVLYKNDNIIAFLLFAKRENHLKIPYCYYREEHTESVVKTIVYHINIWKINTCTLFHTELVNYFSKHQSPALYQKKVKRHYIISKIFQPIPEALTVLQDGDGDCSFT